MMKGLMCFIVLCLALGAYSNTCPHTKHIDGIYYKITPGFPVDGTPTEIAVNRLTDDIFITIKMYDNSKKTYILLKNASKRSEIKDLPSKTTDVAIDQRHGIVYFATAEGLLKYDEAEKKAVATGITEATMEVFASGNGKYVFYTTVKQDHVYKLDVTSWKKEIVKDLPIGEQYEIDRHLDIYFIKDRIPYVFPKGASSAEKITNLPDRAIVDFAVNKDDKMYALSYSGIVYKIVKIEKDGGTRHEYKGEEWAHLGFDVSALAFTGDNSMVIGADKDVSYLINSGPTCSG